MAQSNRIIEHYKEMKEELEELHLANLSKRDVANIIEEFQHNINSVRVARLITDLKGVISILEARKTLLPENPWALEKIAQIVDRPYGQERINEYKRYLKATTLLYEQRHQEPNVEFNCKPRLIDIVFEEISQHLVNDWRMFARCLELKENEICQIENSNRGKEKAAIQVFKKFQEKNPNADHMFLVINALKSINRFQLVRNVEAIITSNVDSR